jgi:hypothetical protein
MHTNNNINGLPDIGRTNVYTLDKSGALLDIQKNLVRKIVNELNGFDNLMYEICNEPYFGGVTMEWQHAIADLITATEKLLPKKHLTTQNIGNGALDITHPHPSVSVFNFHYAYPPDAIARNYHLNKVIGDNETGFRGNSDSTYRFEGWRFMIGGGGLYNNLDYSFTAGNENGSFSFPATQPGGGSERLREQLSYLKKFLHQFDFIRMKPDSIFVASGIPVNAVFNGLAEDGRQYALYVKGGNNLKLQLKIPDGKYEAVWMHPSTGKYEKTKTVTSKNGKAVISSPAYSEDIALRLIKKSN